MSSKIWRLKLSNLTILVVFAAMSMGVVELSRRSAHYRNRADFCDLREKRLTETFERLQKISGYNQLSPAEAKESLILLDVGQGGSLCVSPPQYYREKIARYKRMKESYKRAMWHPWDTPRQASDDN